MLSVSQIHFYPSFFIVGSLDRIDKFTVEDRTDCDHQPISATFKVTYRRGEVDEEMFPRTKEKIIEIWNERTIEEF